MYGGLIVHRPAPKSTVRGLIARESARYDYDKELLLLVGDWYHRPADQVLAWYMRAGSFGNEVWVVLLKSVAANPCSQCLTRC